MNKRNIMNLVLLGGISLPAIGLAGPYGEAPQQQSSLPRVCAACTPDAMR